MARKSDGIRLHVRIEDGSRSSNRDAVGAEVPTGFGPVGDQGPAPAHLPTRPDSGSIGESAEEADRVFAWATAALLGDVPEVDIAPSTMALIRQRRAS